MLMYSVTLLPPFALSLAMNDGNATAFSVAWAEIAVLGLIAWLPNRHSKAELTPRDGFEIGRAHV